MAKKKKNITYEEEWINELAGTIEEQYEKAQKEIEEAEEKADIAQEEFDKIEQMADADREEALDKAAEAQDKIYEDTIEESKLLRIATEAEVSKLQKLYRPIFNKHNQHKRKIARRADKQRLIVNRLGQQILDAQDENLMVNLAKQLVKAKKALKAYTKEAKDINGIK